MTRSRTILVAVAVVGSAVLAFVLGLYSPNLLASSRANRLIESMEAQEGGNYAGQADALLALGPQSVPPLLERGLASQNEWVRNTSVEVLDTLAWQNAGSVHLVGVFQRVASDDGEHLTVRHTAARAFFNHVGRAPAGWEAYLHDGTLRFRPADVESVVATSPE